MRSHPALPPNALLINYSCHVVFHCADHTASLGRAHKGREKRCDGRTQRCRIRFGFEFSESPILLNVDGTESDLQSELSFLPPPFCAEGAGGNCRRGHTVQKSESGPGGSRISLVERLNYANSRLLSFSPVLPLSSFPSPTVLLPFPFRLEQHKGHGLHHRVSGKTEKKTMAI